MSRLDTESHGRIFHTESKSKFPHGHIQIEISSFQQPSMAQWKSSVSRSRMIMLEVPNKSIASSTHTSRLCHRLLLHLETPWNEGGCFLLPLCSFDLTESW